jgi:hypothetical protein
MDFVDYLIEVINDNENQKNKYNNPLQLIIFEYAYSKCYDCKKLLDEDYKCNNCNIIRCKFHYFVNCVDICCVECQNYDEDSLFSYYYPYKCVVCDSDSDANVGYIDNVILSKHCSMRSEYTDLINFDDVCAIKNCCGTGWFSDKLTGEIFCMKHKNKDCEYAFLDKDG